MRKAILHLENSLEFQGYSFGYEYPAEGEVVFSTAMVGYPESLTDPSYSGQILCVTYPIIGNYGVPENKFRDNGISINFESEKIHVKGVIISDYSFKYSHWSAVKSLDEWLKEYKIPGIFGVDTREITKTLRDKGALLGSITPELFDTNPNPYDPNKENQVDIVSCKEVIRYGNSNGKKIVLLDCGVKHNIIRCLLKRDLEIIRVPWNFDYNQLEYDGLFISNGPGNPEFCNEAVKNIKKTMDIGKPIFGICMGNQLLAKAGGASTFKLKYGHRSHNQPVRLVGTDRCFITSQNHGYAVDGDTLGKDWSPFCVNMNDGTNEGIKHKNGKFFSVQFHPEASSGPTDTEFLFDDFINLL